MRRRRVLVATLVMVLLLGACGSDDEDGAGTADTTESASGSDGGAATEGDAEHNDADVEFAQGMIPHHSQAVEMADMAIAAAESPEVKSLAEQIKAAQQPEIEMLTGWLESWDEEVPSEGNGMGHGSMDGGGMMSEEDMASLESSTGAAFDRMFLEMMIEHHEGAIAMAETEVEEGQFPGAIEMAETIGETQQEEINEMEQMLQAS